MPPPISVVMGVCDDADFLCETVDSVLAQTMQDFELVIVDDGSTDPRVGDMLDRYRARDPRVTVLRKANEGLTLALIDGCNAATGDFICRIDVGDTMAPQRLQRQSGVLAAHPDCVFVSSYTEFHGPAWESLWVSKGKGRSEVPADILPQHPDEGLADDITHHGSVMFGRSAYVAAGGYRREFYYGQDWDLWYRLAERGRYCLVPEILYHARILPRGISLRNAERQRAVAECSRGAFVARRTGADERTWLARAAQIRPASSTSHVSRGAAATSEPGYYFIGEALRRNGDAACRRYLREAIRQKPWGLRSYARLAQSLLLGPRRRASS